MDAHFTTISPIDGKPYCEYPFTTSHQQQSLLTAAKKSQQAWQQVPLVQRMATCQKIIAYFEQHKAAIGEEITWQMGRPISQSSGEVNGLIERTQYMIDIATESLQDSLLPEKTNFTRMIRLNPIGLVLVIAPWNYPYLTAVNAIVPAILAGNAVILKHSNQTPKCAQRFLEAFQHAELPEGVFQIVTLDHQQTEQMIARPEIDFVAFTGSVQGGQRVQQALRNKFVHCGLELGGKDPAYVREDCEFNATVENLVDGAFFNSGQSCCGIERIYVAASLYDDFIAAFSKQVTQYRLGNPLDRATTLGPVVRSSAANFIREQIKQATELGAHCCIDATAFNTAGLAENYLAPQVLTKVNHQMSIMTEESFGPVVGIMPVTSDQQAIELMNDSAYGLTASVWTQDCDRAITIGNQVQTGTWFMNRCDYLDPALVWTGVKNTGKGYSLSHLGYQQLTQAKSYHLRHSLT